MTRALGLALDAATLVLLTSYVLSAIAAALAPARRIAGAEAERAAWRRVVMPPIGGALVVLLGFGSALLDAWRVTPDHCGDTTTHQPYLCWPHPIATTAMSGTETLAILLLILALASVLWRAARWLDGRWRLEVLVSMGASADETAFRHRLAVGGGAWPGPITVIRSDAPICGVSGVRRPRLFVSTAIAERLTPAEIAVVVAHERAHVARRDPLRRLLAHLLLVAHAPGLGRRAFEAWSLAAEMACDRAAARSCGSSVAVAETLVRYRRAFAGPPAAPVPVTVIAFADAEDLEARVRGLIAPPIRARKGAARRRLPWLLLALALALAPGLHVGLESLLRLLHA